MRLPTACILGLVVTVAILGATPAWAAEPESEEDDSAQVRNLLEQLGLQYARLEDQWIEALPPDGAEQSDPNLTDEQWLELDREARAGFPSPDVQLLPEFIALAEKYPESPFALDALAFVIQRGGPHTGDVHGEPWRLKEQAIDLVLEKHMDDPRVVHVFDLLGGSLASKKTESFLRNAFETSPDRTTRAAAGISLARYLNTIDRALRRSKQLKTKQGLLNFERFWNAVVTPYLEVNSVYAQGELASEIERILVQVIEEYSDVPAVDWRTAGPSNVFLRSEAYEHPRTYGDLAKAMLFELNNLVPGKVAPDIDGVDAEGNRFRLSDYRGDVVLLTFSANWCGGCVKLYPLQRRLVERFRDEPFILLSVSQDETVDTLQESLKSGEITWRCWWDGLDGPIRNAWNCRGVPGIFLLDDQHVIQDVLLNRFSSQDEFESAITSLLRRNSAAEPAAAIRESHDD